MTSFFYNLLVLQLYKNECFSSFMIVKLRISSTPNQWKYQIKLELTMSPPKARLKILPSLGYTTTCLQGEPHEELQQLVDVYEW